MRKGSGKAANFNLNEASDIYDPYNAKNNLQVKLNIISACKAIRHNQPEGPQNNLCMDLQSRYLERKSRAQTLFFVADIFSGISKSHFTFGTLIVNNADKP